MDKLNPNVVQKTQRLQQKAANPATSAWVVANAGSGKTKVLTDRVLRLLLEKVPPRKILCLTFTKAAAAEMLNRVTERLSTWASLPETTPQQNSQANLVKELTDLTGQTPTQEQLEFARQLCIHVLDAQGGLKIQNIHSFCQSLLGRFPIEAGLSTHLDIIDDRTQNALYEEALNNTIAQTLVNASLKNSLNLLTQYTTIDNFRTLIHQLMQEREVINTIIHRYGTMDNIEQTLYGSFDIRPHATKQSLIMAACQENAQGFNRQDLEALLDGYLSHKKPSATVKSLTDILADFLSATTDKERFQLFETYTSHFLTKTLTLKKALGTPFKDAPLSCLLLKAEAQRLIALFEKIKHLTVAQTTMALLRFFSHLQKDYAHLKRQHAILDYDDLIFYTQRLLTQDSVATQWVLFKLDGGIDHILVDEAQDTNPEQWQIISAIAKEFFSGQGRYEDDNKVRNLPKRSLFVVGDEKQSIYSFQRADPALFEAMKNDFQHDIRASRHSFNEVPLNTSFRSTHAILRAVDAVFYKSMPARTGLTQDPSHIIHHDAARNGKGYVCLYAPIGPPQKEDENKEEKSLSTVENHEEETPLLDDLWEPAQVYGELINEEQELCNLVAQNIVGWIGNRALAAHERPVKAGDILLLFRTRSSLFHQMAKTLKNYGLPLAGIDRISLNKELVVQDMMALAKFLVLPNDNLSLANVLKGPLVNLDDDDIFALTRNQKNDLWQNLKNHKEEKYQSIVVWLKGLLAKLDYLRPFELFNMVLNEPCPTISGSPFSTKEKQSKAVNTGYQAIVARLGPDSRDPLNEFLTLVLNHETQNPPMMRHFLEWFEQSQTQIKRDTETQARNEIRMMTIHGAKGLQSPVVILPDTRRGRPPRSYSLYHPPYDAKKITPPFLWCPASEYKTTFIKKMDEEKKAKFEEEENRLLYVAMTRAADELHVFGIETTPINFTEPSWYQKVCLGFMQTPQYQNTLCPEGDLDKLDDSATFTTRVKEFLAQKGRVIFGQEPENSNFTPQSDPILAPHAQRDIVIPDFLEKDPKAENIPQRPLIPSQSIDETPVIHSPLVAVQKNKFQRGLLIHKLLEVLPSLPAQLWASRAKLFVAHYKDTLSPKEQDKICKEVLTVLHHPQLKEVFGPQSQSEASITGYLGSKKGQGEIVRGQVDRLYVGDNKVMVLDYKSHRPVPKTLKAIPKAYLKQMAIYCAILGKIYQNHDVEGYIVWTNGPIITHLRKQILEQYLSTS